MTYKVAIFDLDDTLAPSKSPIDASIAAMLSKLATGTLVSIISGGKFEQFEAQVVAHITDNATLDALHMMPTCGTRYLTHADGEWIEVYREPLTDDEVGRAVTALTEGAKELGLWEENPAGDRIENRGSQVTFSALGQTATVADKSVWDPDGAKKESLRALIQERLPDLEVRSGGSTSIDITRRGIDKAYGVNRLLEYLKLAPDDALFFGDRLDEGGNDYPVYSTGVRCVAVAGWEETAAAVAREFPSIFG